MFIALMISLGVSLPMRDSSSGSHKYIALVEGWRAMAWQAAPLFQRKVRRDTVFQGTGRGFLPGPSTRQAHRGHALMDDYWYQLHCFVIRLSRFYTSFADGCRKVRSAEAARDSGKKGAYTRAMPPSCRIQHACRLLADGVRHGSSEKY